MNGRWFLLLLWLCNKWVVLVALVKKISLHSYVGNSLVFVVFFITKSANPHKHMHKRHLIHISKWTPYSLLTKIINASAIPLGFPRPHLTRQGLGIPFSANRLVWSIFRRQSKRHSAFAGQCKGDTTSWYPRRFCVPKEVRMLDVADAAFWGTRGLHQVYVIWGGI